ncbi:MAG: T9SS type A sorting domain-containing protein [Flavobacteriales bacterium]
MRKLISFLMLLAVVATHAQDTESEPNNTFTEADALSEGVIMTGVVCTETDVFVLTLPSPGVLTFATDGLNITGNPVLFQMSVRNQNQGQFGANNLTLGAGEAFEWDPQFTCRDEGTYYFSFTGTSNCVEYALSYTFSGQALFSEEEPNNSTGEAMAITDQSQVFGGNYFTNAAVDQFDFYSFSVASFGTLELTMDLFSAGDTGGGVIVNLLKSDGAFAQTQQAVILGGQDTNSDTLYFYGIEPGNYFFRMGTYSANCIYYQFSYELTSILPNTETEPNSFQSQFTQLQENEAVQGHLNFHSNSPGTDPYDWYGITLNGFGTLTIHLVGTNLSGGYNSGGTNVVFESYYLLTGYNSVEPEPGATDSLELTFHCLAPGNYFLQLSSLGPFAYTLSYSTDLAFDNEEDESGIGQAPELFISQAQEIALNEPLNGNLGYQGGYGVDQHDYFKVGVSDSTRVTISIDASSESAAEGAYYQLVVYNGLQQQISGTTVNFTPFGEADIEFPVNCVNTDTLYCLLVVPPQWWCLDYTLTITEESVIPAVSIDYTRLGNTIGFIPEVQNGDVFFWDFDDGATSTGTHPLHTYAFGNYSAQLTVTNSQCNYSTTAVEYFELVGIESYNPKKGGQGGNTAMEIFGGGLSEETDVKLIKDGIEIIPIETYSVMESNVFRVIFDLHLAEVGLYDVHIQIPGYDLIVYEDGFEIEEFVYPLAWSQVVGPDLWRTGRDTPFSLVVGHNGNVTASGVIVGLVFPYEIEVELNHDLIMPADTGLFEIMVDDTLYSLDRSELTFMYDSMSLFFEIDTLWGEPYHGWYGTFKIPYIPAGHTYELPFIARGNTVMPVEFITFTHRPNVFGSPTTPNWYDTIENLGVEAIDLVDIAADESRNVPLQVLTKTLKVGRQHLAADARIIGARFWGWWDGYEVADETYTQYWKDIDAANAYAMKTGAEVVRDQFLSLGEGYLKAKSYERIKDTNAMLAKQGHKLTDESFERVVERLNSETESMERISALFKTMKDAGTLADKVASIEEMVNNCPELQYLLDDLLQNSNDNLNPNNIRKTPTTLAGSYDPNAIYGPMGVGGPQFLNNLDKQFFIVAFENLETATASAQVVRVVDTLDVTVFDPATFEFGDITIAGQGIRVPRGRQQFALDFIPENVPDYIVRLNGDFDSETGVITWLFTTLDPVTESLPLFDGFLPPNVESPEGEGYLHYMVSPRNDLVSGQELASLATIYFDTNEPITTNTWVNTLDTAPPVSEINAFVSNDTIVNIQLSGIDSGCGISHYKVFVSADGGPFLPLFTAFEEELVMVGELETTYGLYCIAYDSLGNGEMKEAIAEIEITTGIKELARSLPEFRVYPNPGTGEFYLRSDSFLQNAWLIVYNATGSEILRTQINSRMGEVIPLNLTGYTSGQYLIRVETEKGGFAVQQVISLDR